MPPCCCLSFFVEGITEWLPISSTGHLILVEELIPFDSQNVGEDFFGMFDVVIQLGAILPNTTRAPATQGGL